MRRVLIGVIASTMLLAVGQAKGDSIAFYNEAHHVRGGVGELLNSLTNPNHSITPFDDDDNDDKHDAPNINLAWSQALNSADILVLPSLNDQTSHTFEYTVGQTRQLVEAFVFNGKGLIVLGSTMFGSIFPQEFGDSPSRDDLQGSYSTWFLNKVFDSEGSSDAFNLKPDRFVASASKDMKRKSSIDAPFNDDPPELPISNATSLLNIDLLPAGALNVYYEVGPEPLESPLTSSVFAAQYGRGKIAFLGFDWSTGNTAETADWNKVLDSAVEYVRPEEVNVVPEPTTLALWQLGAAGVVLAIRRRRRK